MNIKGHLILVFILLGGAYVVRAQKAETITPVVEVNLVRPNSPSELIISSPSNFATETTRGFKPKGQSILFKGQVRDEEGIDSLLVNGQPVVIFDEGNFNFRLQLAKGVKQVLFRIVDGEGEITTQSFKLDEPNLSEDRLTAGKYYALLIGVNDYSDPTIQDLLNPIADAKLLQEVLINDYTFDEKDVDLMENATRKDIIDALEQLKINITPEDNVVIFYAGHGVWNEVDQLGYWIPSDAEMSSTADWFANSRLTDMIRAIRSRHTLLIADACFSGSIFRTRSISMAGADRAVTKKYELPSRKAMTSGSLNEVPDESAFLHYLIKRLKANKKAYLSSSALFVSMEEAVINNSDVIPRFGTIQKVGDEGGEFIFIRKQ